MRTHCLPAIIVRGSNNYGPFQYPEKLIPLAITNLLEGEKIPIHGTGEHIRSWLHVHDFCSAIDCIMHRAPLLSVYNVAGEEKTNLQIVTMIARHLSKSIEQHKIHVNDRPGADMRYALSDEKLKKELQWAPRCALATHLKETVAWYQTNEWWWRALKRKKQFLTYYEKQARGQWF